MSTQLQGLQQDEIGKVLPEACASKGTVGSGRCGQRKTEPANSSAEDAEVVKASKELQEERVAAREVPAQAFQSNVCKMPEVVSPEELERRKICPVEPPLPEVVVVPHPLLPVPKPSTSYELRGSKLLVGCGCLKRNGMQHDCGRSECQGRRECLRFPAPNCRPSGLAPPIVVPSPIIAVDEPDCDRKEGLQKTKKQIEQRKILLNYARSQYVDNPPRPLKPLPPCRSHVRGLYYVRPPRRSARTQTEEIPAAS